MANNNINKTNRIKGFSLLELVVVLIVSGIILSGLVVMYRDFMRVHRRQERTMMIERSLQATQTTFRDSLLSLPARGLATSSGSLYDIALLPYAGFIYDGVKNNPIRLGIITPYKINGNDAFTLVYSDTKIPRLPVDPEVTQIGNTKTIRVPLPTSIDTQQPSLGSISKGELPNDDNPNPDPSSTNNTSSSIPTLNMFKIGQLMLLMDTPSFSTGATQPKQPLATLVRLVNVTKTTANNRQFLEFTVDICENNNCGQLTNDPAATGNVSSGSTLVPIKFTSFYLTKDQFGNKVMRNDDGLILPDGSGGFAISGGKETIVGESDSLIVNYNLRDGSTAPTPNNPLVPWLNSVFSVDVVITGAMAGNQGTEYFDRTRKINFPIISRNLE